MASTEFPAVAGQVVAPQSPVIELDGTQTSSANGIYLTSTANGSVIRGLAINRFDLNGIVLTQNNHTIIERCYIGTDTSGLLDYGNGQDGIWIGGWHAAIGGITQGSGNIISGNDGNGIYIGNYGAGKLVLGNLIGTDATGSTKGAGAGASAERPQRHHHRIECGR